MSSVFYNRTSAHDNSVVSSRNALNPSMTAQRKADIAQHGHTDNVHVMCIVFTGSWPGVTNDGHTGLP